MEMAETEVDLEVVKVVENVVEKGVIVEVRVDQ